MSEIDCRKELENARKGLQSSHKVNVEIFWEIICGDVLVAEENCQNQLCMWENASLAEELLQCLNQIKIDDTWRQNINFALSRMIDCIADHPRLLVRLYEAKLSVCDGDECGDIDEEITFLRQNISYADNSEWYLIVNKGFLKRDPIEWILQWEQNIDRIDKMVYERIGEHFGMGYCHAFWHERAVLLESETGIVWRSPARMNPGCIFD